MPGVFLRFRQGGLSGRCRCIPGQRWLRVNRRGFARRSAPCPRRRRSTAVIAVTHPRRAQDDAGDAKQVRYVGHGGCLADWPRWVVSHDHAWKIDRSGSLIAPVSGRLRAGLPIRPTRPPRRPNSGPDGQMVRNLDRLADRQAELLIRSKRRAAYELGVAWLSKRMLSANRVLRVVVTAGDRPHRGRCAPGRPGPARRCPANRARSRRLLLGRRREQRGTRRPRGPIPARPGPDRPGH